MGGAATSGTSAGCVEGTAAFSVGDGWATPSGATCHAGYFSVLNSGSGTSGAGA